MRYARELCVWCVYIICAWASFCDAQVISSFSAPEVEHVSYHFSPSVDETVTLLLRDGGSDTKIGEATHPNTLSGIYRVPLSGSTLEFVLKTVKDTNTTENVVRTLSASSSISGTAIFDENPLAVPEGTHSGGFFAASDVTVSLDGSGVTWSNSVNFGGAGTIDISGARFETFYSSAQALALTTCYFSKQVYLTAQSAWITDCLFNGRDAEVPVDNSFTVSETLEMVNCEVVENVHFWLEATSVTLSQNTFYGTDETAFHIREASEGAVISVRNNTILGRIQYGGYPIDEAHNYYGAPPSSNFELLEAGWLNPWHLVEKGFVAADHGITEHCSLPDPRNVPAIRSITYAAGQEVMIQQTGTSGYEYYPESFSGYLRAGEPIAMSFRIEPYMNSLAGASYELKYGGVTYSPKTSYTAEIGTDDIQSRLGNANSALNFIVPADAAGTNMWELWADFSGCPANIVASSLVSQKIANGGVVVREGFARPLRIGVLELQLDDGYAIPRCDPRSRAKAIKRIKDDLVMKLPLKDAEVDIVDLGPYQFTGGLLSSWFSQTDLGRANQEAERGQTI